MSTASEVNPVKLTKKERWVLEQLGRGMFLRDRKFSWLYEVAPTRAAGLRANDCIGPVNRRLVENLQSRELIGIGFRSESSSGTYVLTDKGRAAISS